MSKPKNVKQAMDNDGYVVKNIYSKGSKTIRVDFKPRFANSKNENCSFWINRDYFKRNYPRIYNKF